ncbi:hypothetical protein GFC01_03795 [Desulfofundulus thermobenzoicus]|uniref:DUF5678 domain-containing protein n=1 Tax=Desulfofundulus thermobenzoicus TaxID=29376 RepID=A0A6N7IP79_9FIRM|nr:hypothetical protein [Desulfofundulus thermobenzoicus]MQL51399.1 hypothetical protein [Desulfofundulus thermobenzoicus]
MSLRYYPEEIVKRNAQLYEKYGRQLEKEHKGKYIAISEEGQIIVDSNDIRVAQQAIEKFGPGRFAFYKIGYKAIGKWRAISACL